MAFIKTYRAALALLVLFTYALIVAWPEAMVAFGIPLPGGWWFIDIYALLASSDAFAMGLDPYQPNPLDLLHVPHWYSDWWFWMNNIGLSRGDARWLGVVMGALFLGGALLFLRVRDFTEMLVCWLALCSPVLVLGVNRANPDLVIFSAMAGLACMLTSRIRAVWLLGPGVIAFLAGLKFYPLAALAALPFVPRPGREIAVSLGFMLLLVVLVGSGVYDDVLRVAPLIDAPVGYYTFGAGQIFLMAEMPHATLLALGVGMVLAICCWFHPPALPEQLPEREVVAFVLGAATVVGCYFVGVSFSYRLVFALLMLPLLGTLRLGEATAHRTRGLAWAGLGGMVLLLWLDGLACVGLNLALNSFSSELSAHLRAGVFVAVALAGWLWVGCILGLLAALARRTAARLCGKSVLASAGA